MQNSEPGRSFTAPCETINYYFAQGVQDKLKYDRYMANKSD